MPDFTPDDRRWLHALIGGHDYRLLSRRVGITDLDKARAAVWFSVALALAAIVGVVLAW